ncbi:hypothetical protein B0H63DRAFT_443263 [Podospora didyma]|uniref:NADP-dependent oxidoreductase domain-containing protein n=1 Tax=Podospora didyma TaxID=330526 RepID=A0AAE0P441_9PEZI|nr:hypothetical protein B0H63DRAFT_443263 [Podospora didyma]
MTGKGCGAEVLAGWRWLGQLSTGGGRAQVEKINLKRFNWTARTVFKTICLGSDTTDDAGPPQLRPHGKADTACLSTSLVAALFQCLWVFSAFRDAMAQYGTQLLTSKARAQAKRQLGFGTDTRWSKRGDPTISRQLVDTIKTAMGLGFTHFDCADGMFCTYLSQRFLLGLPSRSRAWLALKIYVTTKVRHGVYDIPKALNESLGESEVLMQRQMAKGMGAIITSSSEIHTEEYLRVNSFGLTEHEIVEMDRLGAPAPLARTEKSSLAVSRSCSHTSLPK